MTAPRRWCTLGDEQPGPRTAAPAGQDSTDPQPAATRRVLLVSQDIVSADVAGPGVRYLQLARGLAPHCRVKLAVPDDVTPAARTPDFELVGYTRAAWPSLEPHVTEADVVVFPGGIANDFPQLADADPFLVVDGYDPLLAEWLALTSSFTVEDQHEHWRRRMSELGRQYVVGDFYVCASERQRDWWLGLLEANQRVNAWTYRDDPSLRSLIDVVPIGVAPGTPSHDRQVLKGAVPGIGYSDQVVIWGGGLWPWLDPVSAVRAVALMSVERPRVRLVLPGVDHPNPWMHGMPTALDAARAAADESGLVGRSVFFTGWIAHSDWTSALLEADAALSLSLDTLENRLAFRTRVIDYIRTGVPVVATRGDATSDLVSQFGIGALADAGDVQGIAEALARVLDTPREAFAPGFARAQSALALERTIEPLARYCRDPRRAPDRAAMPGGPGQPFPQAEIDRLRDDKETLLAERRTLLDEIDRIVGERAEYARAGHELALAYDATVDDRDAWRARYEGQWFVRARRAAYRLWRRTPTEPG